MLETATPVFSAESYLRAVGVKPETAIEDVVVLVFNADVFEIAAQRLGADTPRRIGGGRRAFFRVERSGIRTRFFLSGDGGPVAAMAIEILVARGVKALIGLGYVGSLRPDVAIGDFVVPTAAVRDEGTSAHYLPPACPAVADFGLTRALTEAAAARRPTHTGLVWSTDAPFRESASDVERWRALGVLGVDMETAAMLACARALHLPAALLQVVSDDLSSLQWHAGYEACQAALPYALGAVLDTIKEVNP